jgi:hypothetical protein
MVAIGFTLSACTESKITSISLKPGTLPIEVHLGEIVDTSGVEIFVEYDNNSVKKISGTDVVVGYIDTTTAGKKAVNIVYQEVTTQVDITVLEIIDEDALFAGYENPNAYSEYLSNIGTQQDPRNEFKIKNDGYYVGTDNAFKFLPKLTLLASDELTTFYPSMFENLVKIEQKLSGESTFVDITDDEDEIIVRFDSIDTSRGLFHFGPAAIGNTYKISMKYAYATPLNNPTITIEVKVVAGYNAYTIADLSRMNNNGPYWDAYKFANGVDSANVSSVILHNDISLNRNNLPATFFEQTFSDELQTTVWSLVADRTTIFEIDIADSESFTFIGNYFELDASTLPLRANKTTVADSHSVLFNLGADTGGDWTLENEIHGNYTFKNLRSKGNSNREEREALAGGVKFANVAGTEVRFENSIFTAFQTAILTSTFTLAQHSIPYSTYVENCKVFDTFSNGLSTWNSKLHIINTDINGTGGPAIISIDSSDNSSSNPEDSRYPDVYIDAQSIIAVNVTGEEVWFSSHGAGPLPSTMGIINGELAQFGKTLKNSTGHFNMISLQMPGDILDSFTAVGTVQYGSFALDMSGAGMTILSGIAGAIGALPPAFVGADGKLLIVNPDGAAGQRVWAFDPSDNTLMALLMNPTPDVPTLMAAMMNPSLINSVATSIFSGNHVGFAIGMGSYLGITLSVYNT